MHNKAMVFMLNDRKNHVARYRSFLDTLYASYSKLSKELKNGI